MEKILKAHVVSKTNDLAPPTHDLLRLAELAGIELSEERRTFLSRFQQYCLEGRYPEFLSPLPSPQETRRALEQSQEMWRWLTSLFKT